MSTPLRLDTWQVWHHYSTYCPYDIVDLDAISRLLIETGIAQATISSTGKARWRAVKGIQSAMVSFDGQQAHLSLGGPVRTYVAECLSQALEMEAARRHAFPGHPRPDQAYVRAFCVPIVMRFGEKGTTLLYPQLLIIEPGVLITEFRTLSPDGGTTVEELLRQVNLFDHEAREISVSPQLLLTYARAIAAPLRGPWNTWLARHVMRLVKDLIQQHSRQEVLGEFEFRLTALTRDTAKRIMRPQDPRLGLRFAGQILEIAVGAGVLARPEVLGRVNARHYRRQFTLGEAWTGRPSVYLMRFGDQPAKASEAVAMFKPQIAQILLRNAATAPNPDQVLGESGRMFDDYAVFVNSALYLWILSSADAPDLAADPNGARAVIHKQVLVEYLEFRWGQYLRLRHLVERPHSSIAALARREQELLSLSEDPRRASRYGEIWEFVALVESRWNVPQLREMFREGVRLRSAALEEIRTDRQQWFGWLLTLLLGIGVSETVATHFLRPLFGYLKWHLPGKGDVQDLLLNCLSLGVVSILIAIGWYMTIGRKPHV